MKKALNLIIMYFIFLAGALIFGTLLYALFSNLLSYVAGSKLKLFSADGLIRSFFYISFCVLFLICPVTAFYRTRHPGGFSQSIAYLIVCLLSWGILLPVNYKLYSLVEEDYFSEPEKRCLSKDFFRQAGDDVYYFTDDFKETDLSGMKADAVVIHTGAEPYVSYKPVLDSSTFVLNSAARPFREILVSQNFNSKTGSSTVDFPLLVADGRQAYESGILSFIFYLSFGLALCSVYMLTGLFDWRLLNSTLLFLLSTLVLCFNSGFFDKWLSSVRAGVESNVVYRVLGRWSAEPLVFTGNCLFALVILIIWIISWGVKNHKQKAE